MNAMAISVGRARRIAVRASRPPADAPIATTGISSDVLLGDGLCTWEEGIRHRPLRARRAFRTVWLDLYSISSHPKCTPTVKIRTHVSVAGALTSRRPSPLVSKREIWADCRLVNSYESDFGPLRTMWVGKRGLRCGL